MNVLVVGGGGYVGSILVPKLLEKNYDVSILDKLFFGEEPIQDFKDKIEVLNEDIRTFDKEVLEGFDAVINLAAISQPDQTEKIAPGLYYEINHEGCVRVAKLSKKAGVPRYIFTSTCSVYGFQDGIISEENTPNPLEAYGKSKVLAEKETLPLADDNFTVTILRPGTMYGLSPKMRFDLVVNGMTWALQEFGKINVMRDGNQWRPNVHVKDVVRLLTTLLEKEKELIQQEIFNVGANDQNYQIMPLAKLIGDSVGVDYETDWYGEPDTRSYRVDFSKLLDQLGFKIKHTVPEAARNVYDALEKGKTEKNTKTSIVAWYEKITNEGMVKPLNT
ncbi:MAG: NAD-dependent epimerase/dehydratase family protein [Candidatus Lokiarchaeota archaeon]|nr:NAD-dependent epimerase/dehydratase family protein [Candidatus Lokiarchaeota archaeon]MBD3200815.1 NAD-dependent epimerase/dehydratase family protein [Candidatus Lokiarchaeota archaeon]